MGEDDD